MATDRMFMPAVVVLGLKETVVTRGYFAEVLTQNLYMSGKVPMDLVTQIDTMEDDPGAVRVGYPMTAQEFLNWGCVLSAELFDMFKFDTADTGCEFLCCSMVKEQPMADVVIANLYLSDDQGKTWAEAKRHALITKAEATN